MEKLIDIRLYKGEEKWEITVCGLKREMPICQVNDELWILANEHLSFGCDIEFTQRMAAELSHRLREFDPQCILAPEAKALALAYETARNLRHQNYIIARKELKSYIKRFIAIEIESITTKGMQRLFLDEFTLEQIEGKRVALMDDVISTGGTMKGLKILAEKAGANVCAIAAIWIEGPWYWEKFRNEIDSGKLIYLDMLPIFAVGQTYQELLEKEGTD